MRIGKTGVIILLYSVIFLAACGKKETPAPVAEPAKPAFFFKVQFILGDVKVSVNGAEKPAAQGDRLNVGDVIITGKKSVVDLIFGESGVIRVNENSNITVSNIADKAGGETVMDMNNGKVFLTLSKLKGTGFKVKTPTAVAGVRGTSFSVTSDKKGAKLSVMKGTVAVNPVKDGKVIEDKSIAVESGNKTGYIDKKSVEKIINGKMEIPVMEMTPSEKIEIQTEAKEIKVEEIAEISLELKEDIKKEIAVEPAAEEKKVEVKEVPAVNRSDDKAAARRKLAEEKRMKEEEEKRLVEEKRQKEAELKRLAEEKKIKEEKQKKDRASNIPTM